MKRANVAALWVFAASFVLVTTILMSAEADARLLDRGLSLEVLALQLRTPEQIARYMWRHFAFETDQRQFGQSDHWQSPEELLANQKGDCEDFAIFAHSLLKLNGIPSLLLNIYGRRFAHTVCMFKQNGKYHVIDGAEVKHFEAEDIKALSSELYPFWEKTAVVTPSPARNRGTILTEFTQRVKARQKLATFA